MKFKRIVCMLILFLIVFQTGISVYAKTPYASYFLAYADTNDDGGWTLPTPAAYLPLETLDFVSTEEGKLSSPEDMFLKDDLLYVCDTGNNRIVVYQKDENGSFKFKYIIADPTKLSADDPARLNSPMGLFVDDNGTILVADTGNKRLVEFTKYGNLRYVYNQPDNPILHYDGFVYSPLKVIKDSRGYIYVSNSGDYHGLMMFNDKGEFQKYFGANKVALTFFEAISRLFWSREARLGTEVKLPYSFNNVLATSDAIYTTTTGTGVQVRKLNSAGSDIMFNPDQNYNDFNVTWYAPSFDPKQQVFCDVAVDSDENMTILDNSYGRIYQYDSIGRNLFAFGTTGPAPSQFTDPVGLEIDDLGNIYVLDKATGTITVFKPTEFANLVHEANRYNIDGKYDLSLPLWNTVLQMDSYYVNALNAMGESYIRQEKYSDAMKVLKISENY
ncbi:MAG: NHL repeat-containing protein, partial [Clostridiales bacterium]|nr:NHL repeat-containing protein [Clostridiales bacterium]